MLLSLPRAVRGMSIDGVARETCGGLKNVDLTERGNS
jgi:hypothetical protein